MVLARRFFQNPTNLSTTYKQVCLQKNHPMKCTFTYQKKVINFVFLEQGVLYPYNIVYIN